MVNKCSIKTWKKCQDVMEYFAEKRSVNHIFCKHFSCDFWVNQLRDNVLLRERGTIFFFMLFGGGERVWYPNSLLVELSFHLKLCLAIMYKYSLWWGIINGKRRLVLFAEKYGTHVTYSIYDVDVFARMSMWCNSIFGRFFRSLFPPYLMKCNRRSNFISYLLPCINYALSQMLL